MIHVLDKPVFANRATRLGLYTISREKEMFGVTIIIITVVMLHYIMYYFFITYLLHRTFTYHYANTVW